MVKITHFYSTKPTKFTANSPTVCTDVITKKIFHSLSRGDTKRTVCTKITQWGQTREILFLIRYTVVEMFDWLVEDSEDPRSTRHRLQVKPRCPSSERGSPYQNSGEDNSRSQDRPQNTAQNTGTSRDDWRDNQPRKSTQDRTANDRHFRGR